jgi:hypothetical protein
MKRSVPFFGVLLLIFSCVKNNPDPAWLEVSEWQLVANPTLGGTEGELTQNISDAWVYIDNEFIGVFEVPFKIPVLKDGTKTILIYPTVLNNGISATKKIYPFLEPFEVTADLVKNEITHLDLVTQYKSNLQFSILDFEDANLGFDDSPSSTTNIIASNDPAIIQPFNGNSFGRVTLTQSNSNWISATNLDQDLPRGQEVYLEVDYHITEDLVTGVLAISPTDIVENPNVQFNEMDPSEVVWKKIYVDLKTIVSGSPNADYFEHSFEAYLDEGKTSAVINIDNVKVVHY